MNLNKGVRARDRSRKSKRTRKPKVSRRSARTLPRTARILSRKSFGRTRVSRANSSMSLTELQFMAKSKGVPFGGLSRAKLIKKINNYY